MFVNIQIKSKNFNSLKQYLKFLLKITNSPKLNLKTILKYSNSQSQKRVFTILKSPHVNKTSQEQFEYSLKTNQLDIDSFQLFKFLFITKKTQKVTNFDVSINIKFLFNSLFYKKNLIKNIMLKNYKVRYPKNTISTKEYLKLIELSGSSVL